jgi:GTPase
MVRRAGNRTGVDDQCKASRPAERGKADNLWRGPHEKGFGSEARLARIAEVMGGQDAGSRDRTSDASRQSAGRQRAAERGAGEQRAALVGLTTSAGGRGTAERSLVELEGLARAAGADVVLRMLQERASPNPATFLGKGKVEMLTAACAELDVDLIIFDNELTPAQLRNLERDTHVAVLDRTQLILDIFARRARTREGQLQVELAQLKYVMPRLVGSADWLSRLGGGIGTRGPGETKLETDRRHVRHRIATISRQIADVKRRRAQLRERRREGMTPTVALVGYTNAGKTTLFNRLAHQRAEASDALFVTLDPLIRHVRFGDGPQVLLSDTVGFIDRLPHGLVAAFRATLEEVVEADLLLHVVDAADQDRDAHMEAVTGVLGEIEAEDVPAILVLNKSDRLTPDERARLEAVLPGSVLISAATGEGLDALSAEVARRLALETQRVRLEFDEHDEGDRQKIARLYRHARVSSHETAGGRVSIEADVPRRLLGRLAANPAR